MILKSIFNYDQLQICLKIAFPKIHVADKNFDRLILIIKTRNIIFNQDFIRNDVMNKTKGKKVRIENEHKFFSFKSFNGSSHASLSINF